MARILRFEPPPKAAPAPEGGSALVVDYATGKPWTPPPPVYVPVKRKRGGPDEEQRKPMLAKIHVAKKQLGLKEEEYRDMLRGNFGVDSSAYLSMEQLRAFLGLLAGVGFKARKRGDAPDILSKAAGPDGETALSPGERERVEEYERSSRVRLLKKIEALLAEKGRVEGTDVPWGYAVAILKRQTDGATTSLAGATAAELRGVVTALVRDAKRKGREVY